MSPNKLDGSDYKLSPYEIICCAFPLKMFTFLSFYIKKGISVLKKFCMYSVIVTKGMFQKTSVILSIF